MEYKKIEEWILNRLPFYQNNGAVAYNPGLNNIDKFINELNLSNNQLKFIHVGGTNGKGSTCSYISSILQESNYKVGTFTSPHFFDFREKLILIPLVVSVLLIGIFPNIFLDPMRQSIETIITNFEIANGK